MSDGTEAPDGAAQTEEPRPAETVADRLRVLQRRSTGAAPLPVGDLTDREWEVVQQVRLGHSNKEIASELHVSRHTVSNHLRAVFRKLGVGSRTELVARLQGMTGRPAR